MLSKAYKRNSAPNGFFLAGLGVLVPFIALASGHLGNEHWMDAFDQAIGQTVVNLRTDGWTQFFRWITILGGTYFSAFVVGVVAVVFFFVFKKKELAIWYISTVALGAGALNQLVKHMFQQPRPNFEHLIVQGGYTFPSGHAMGSIVLYGALIYLVHKVTDNLFLKRFLIGGGIFLVGLIGFSRIYLGVHFVSDILAGYSLGGAVLLLSIGLYRMIEIKQRRMRV